MGEQQVAAASPEEMRAFMQRILEDLRTLETLIQEGRIETGVVRMGAEQELVMVDRHLRPAGVAPEVLERLAARGRKEFTTELARFNLEANLDPLPLTGDCLERLEEQLREILAEARAAAAESGADVVLTGILPTLEKGDLGWESMAPVPRYKALSDAVRRLRGDDFQFHIKGRDELHVQHDTVMMEACNTSFQIHLQVEPQTFARSYNMAQLLAAPVLAAASSSPLLFGKRLWAETRIAVFQQSVDTRSGDSALRRQQPRVSFGESWVEESVVEIFREDLARFRLLLTRELDPPGAGQGDGAPTLDALRLHNGTVYHWNRPCYGVGDGKPHLRIENRVLPSGPTVIDEVANAALWYGLMAALVEEIGDPKTLLPFDAVKENFLAAARFGLSAQLRWLDGRTVPVQVLLQDELLPRARAGLQSLGLDDGGARYLDVVEERVAQGRTGARWMVESLEAMDPDLRPAEKLSCLVEEALRLEKEGFPVHTWPLARPCAEGPPQRRFSRVGSLMSTDLITVGPDEVIDLAAAIMKWRHIRHVPVEEEGNRLVGVVAHRDLLRLILERRAGDEAPVAVREIMSTEMVTVTPQTPTREALGLLRKHRIGCLPVVEGGRLVGIVTERDFLELAERLMS